MADFQKFKQYIDGLFTPQLKVLLQMLKDELPGDFETKISSVDKDEYAKLTVLSSRHKTDYYLLIYFQRAPSLISPELLDPLREKMTRQAVRSLGQLNELIALCKGLNLKGIRYAVIKGPHLARMLYGNAAVKVSVDLDIMMVDPDDLHAFHEVFVEAGYSCIEQKLLTGTWKQRMFISAKREVHYFNSKAGCAVDLHVKPLANTILTANRYKDFFSDIEQVPFEGITIPVLPAEKYFVYLCYHGACHQFSRLGWLLDILNFYRLKRDTLDVEKMMVVARSLNMERPLGLAFAMINILFDADIPEKIKSSVMDYRLMDKLVRDCLKAISMERGEDLQLRARYDRMAYLIKLNKGFAAKVDVVLSMVMRQWVLMLKKSPLG